MMKANAQNTLSPNGVCTFEVTDKQADEYFHKWIKGRKFTPRTAKLSAKPDSFQGIFCKIQDRLFGTDKDGNTSTYRTCFVNSCNNCSHVIFNRHCMYILFLYDKIEANSVPKV